MRFILDTNVCIQMLKKPHGKLALKVKQTPNHELGISIVTAAELLAGASRRKTTPDQLEATEEILRLFTWVPFEPADAITYGRVGGGLMDTGSRIGALDLQIGVTALNRNLITVTHNVSEFRRISGLSVVDWQAEVGEAP